MDSKKNKHSITTENFAKLITIFNEKSWDIDDGDNDCSLFNRFCAALTILTTEEQSLVLELTHHFTKIELGDYVIHLNGVLNRFISAKSNELKSIKNIFIAPLISPKDFGKTKSSTTVQYLMIPIMKKFSEFRSIRISLTDGLDINKDSINVEDSILILVDDFVGGGGTALESIEYLEEDKQIDKSKISVITIATLEKGEESLTKNNIEIFYALKFRRGISDFYNESVLHEKISIMKSIESKIKPHRKEEFGYDQSEALISLIRTPNNTFPVFWKEKKGRLAPFPR